MNNKRYPNLTDEDIKYYTKEAKLLEVDVDDYLEFENEVAGIDYFAPQKSLVY